MVASAYGCSCATTTVYFGHTATNDPTPVALLKFAPPLTIGSYGGAPSLPPASALKRLHRQVPLPINNPSDDPCCDDVGVESFG